jgi:hypothetical protein
MGSDWFGSNISSFFLPSVCTTVYEICREDRLISNLTCFANTACPVAEVFTMWFVDRDWSIQSKYAYAFCT